MARVLIVGCGCRGRELTRSLREHGHVVRGTTRDEERRSAIEAAGAEAVVGDPCRLATLMRAVDGVSVVCWLMASAAGRREDVAALHDTRLRSMLETLVDTHARGFVYEAAGTVPAELLEAGTAIAREAAETFNMPVEIVGVPPDDTIEWTRAACDAVLRTLA